MTDVSTTPGYIFDFSVDLGAGRALAIRGNFSIGAKANEMNGELDKLASVISRQVAAATIPSAEMHLLRLQSQLDASLEDYARLSAKHEGKKLVPNELANKENAEITIQRMKEDVARQVQVIEKLKAEAA
jgi:hypothetical protein